MNRSNFVQKTLFVALAALSASCAVTVGAAVTVLTDTPPLDVSTVKSNFMFTLDNSGSMQETSVPDTMNANGLRPCYKNSTANAVYFDPKATYAPPKNYVGATDTTTDFPNVAFNNAPWDGFNTNASWRSNTGAGWVTTTLPVDLRTNFRADYEYNSTHQAVNPRRGAFYTVYNPTPPFTATKPAAQVSGECHDDAAYTEVDVTTASAAVQQNFANWFSYFRSRMLTMKSAAGLAFSDLDTQKYRVGFHTINNFGATFLNVLDFKGAARQDWYTRLYSQTPSGGTPSRAAHIRIGEYFFGNGAAAGLPGAIDPIQQSCQVNSHFLSTDGFWNESNPAFNPRNIGNVDNLVPALPSPITDLTTGTVWPRPYREDPAPPVAPAINSPTLTDIATYYWATDLRPAMVNNVPTISDPANWQHLVLYGVSIAARGSLPFSKELTVNPITKAKLKRTVTEQTLYDLGPTPATPPTADNPYTPRVWPHPTNNTPTAIDDLWHATVNSRGLFLNADSAKELTEALSALLSKAGSSAGTATGAALGNANLSIAGADNITYVPSYVAGPWTGDLIAKRLDPATGLVTGADIWKHSTILDAQTAGNGWDVSRRILTTANGAVVPLRLSLLTAAQRTALGSPLTVAPRTTSEQEAVLNYLRGDSVNEDLTVETSFKFRPRITRLGDIVDSEPVAVTVPIENYSDSFNPGYQAFKAANALRTPMVYFGANDGLLHAVNGAASTGDAGKEVWSYMPSFLFRTDATGVIGLTYKPADLAPKKFTHRFYVNGSPFVRDVDFARTSKDKNNPSPNPVPPIPATTTDWRSVLVTGLGKGGKGYVALDVTTPPDNAVDELALSKSGRVLWEFTDPDMGFTYGTPLIFKTRRFGWVTALASGYNNVTGPNAGKGIVYIVDIKTGTLLHKFITPEGSATDPIGLANIEAFAPDSTDYTATEIYGGDLLGNVWRFDITADSVAASAYPTSGVKFAQVRDAANQPQPITTYPVPYVDPITATRFVAVGTGKLLDVSDITNSQRQTIYNFRDGTVFEPKKTGLPLNRSVLQEVARSTNVANLSTAAPDGWFQELVAEPNKPSERIIKPPEAPFGVLITYTITPSTDVCDPGAFGTAYARTGLSGDNVISPGTQTFLGGSAGSPQYVGSRVVKLTGGTPRVQVLDSRGNITTLDRISFPGGFQGTVVNYREIIE
jgi:type IV pilus assembly protein PilY1